MSQGTIREEHTGQSCIILVVDDDEAMRTLLADALQERGCRVIESESGHEALECPERPRAECDCDGLENARWWVFVFAAAPGGGSDLSYCGHDGLWRSFFQGQALGMWCAGIF